MSYIEINLAHLDATFFMMELKRQFVEIQLNSLDKNGLKAAASRKLLDKIDHAIKINRKQFAIVSEAQQQELKRFCPNCFSPRGVFAMLVGHSHVDDILVTRGQCACPNCAALWFEEILQENLPKISLFNLPPKHWNLSQ